MADKATLKSNLGKIAHNAELKARQLVERTAFAVTGKTKENIVEMAAVDTGALLNSYEPQKREPLLWAVGSPQEYAPAVEYGTNKMSPRPALTQAGNDPHIKKNFQKTLAFLFK